MNPGRVVAVHLSELLRDILSGGRPARSIATDLRELADWIEKTASKPEEKTKQPSNSNAVREIYEYWLQQTGREAARYRLTAERRKKVQSRLRTYTVADIKAAIDYAAESEFHQGNNDSGKRYDDLTTICMNDTRLETYRNSLGVDETPGAYRADTGSGMGTLSDMSEARKAASDALKKGDMDAYNEAQQRLERIRHDGDRESGSEES